MVLLVRNEKKKADSSSIVIDDLLETLNTSGEVKSNFDESASGRELANENVSNTNIASLLRDC